MTPASWNPNILAALLISVGIALAVIAILGFARWFGRICDEQWEDCDVQQEVAKSPAHPAVPAADGDGGDAQAPWFI